MYLRTQGFDDPATVDEHFQMMAADVVVREALGRIAKDLLPALIESPDPDAAVVGLSQYLAARTGRTMFLEYLGEDPRAMHVLTCVLGSSPYLTEILIRNPEYFHWLVSQVERSAPDRQDLEEELEAMLGGVEHPAEALDLLKRWQRRETLRIATRDLLRRETVPTATAQISDLASLIVERALATVSRPLLASGPGTDPPGVFAVIGVGALGGRELNYKGDIELIYVYDAPPGRDGPARDFFRRVGHALTAALSEPSAESYLYRIDRRSQPGGADIVSSLEECEEHYNSAGQTAERFALVKARPIAGDAGLGLRFIDRVQSFVYRTPPDRPALEAHARETHGGIRDLDVFTQVCQLAYGGDNPLLRQPNTLAALDALVRAGVVSDAVKRELEHAYVLLKSVEHRLQLVGEGRERCLGMGALQDLKRQLAACQDRVGEIYRGLVHDSARARRPGA